MVGPALDFDAVLELSRNEHRRIVLGVLAGHGRPLTINDLSKAIVKHNHGIPVTDASAELFESIAIELVHVHVPKLADHGLVEYDQERRLVEPTAKFEQLQPELSAIVEADPGLDVPVEL